MKVAADWASVKMIKGGLFKAEIYGSIKSLPKKQFNIKKLLSNVSQNAKSHCARKANVNISCTQRCL